MLRFVMIVDNRINAGGAEKSGPGSSVFTHVK